MQLQRRRLTVNNITVQLKSQRALGKLKPKKSLTTRRQNGRNRKLILAPRRSQERSAGDHSLTDSVKSQFIDAEEKCTRAS